MRADEPTDRPTALIIRTAGTNCEREMAHAFELAGAATRLLHLNRLIEDPTPLAACRLVGFPGGFSYGDDIAAGRILATKLRAHLMEPLLAARDRGVPMIGVCNGFQVLVKAGLLPGPSEGARDTSVAAQAVSLIDNATPRFQCRWVPVQAPASKCVWTSHLDTQYPGGFDLPIAHGEGRFTAPPEVLDNLQARGQVALIYGTQAHGGSVNSSVNSSVNGSAHEIAGICDDTGLIFGLMPHPERYTHATNHPAWTRLASDRDETSDPSHTPGMTMFRNAVEHVTGSVPV